MNQFRPYGVLKKDGRAIPLKLLVFGVYFFSCFIRCALLEKESAQYDPRVFQFEDYCNEDGIYDLSLISYNIYKGQLTLQFKETMDDDFKCTVIIGSKGFDRDRLSFYFTEFDMGDNCGPGESWLLVGEGDMTVDPKPIPGLPLRLCGRTFADLGDDKKQFTTEWRHLRLSYHANKPPVGSGFSIIFQHFSDPPCEKWQFLCDNGRCIDKKLKCSGNNPCGDNTDCPATEGLSLGSIIGIVVGCTVGVGMAVFFYRYLPNVIKSSEDNTQRTETDRETANFLRRPINTVPPTERRDETISYDMEPPRYSSLENAENKSNQSADITVNDARSHEPDIAQPGGSRQVAIPSAPTSHGAAENEEEGDTDDYIPPPPSYEMVMNYEEMYSVSDTNPNQV